MVISSIGLSAMADLIQKMTAASNTLTDSGGLIKSSSTHVWGSAAESAKITQAASWVNDQIPGLRRRLALAQQIEAQTQGPQATVSIDEALLSNIPPDQAQADGVEAARKLKESDGKLDPVLIAQITKYQNDPYFAAGFTKNLTTTELSDYLRKVSRQRENMVRDDPAPTAADLKKWGVNYQALVSGMGSALATATRNKGDLALPADFAQKYAAAITEGATKGSGTRVKYGQASALTLLLRYGQYSTDFLGTVSNTVYDYERDHGKGDPVWEPRSYYEPYHTFAGVYMPDGGIMPDPLANIMEALSHNPQAAQNFFDVGNTKAKLSPDVKVNGQSVNDRLQYLLQDRTWKYDNGDGLGNALQAATTNWRDRSENGRISAVTASQAFALLGQKAGDGKADGSDWLKNLDSHPGWKPGTDMRDSLAHIIASYSPDLIRVAGPNTETNDSLGGGWTAEAGDSFPPGGPFGAQMNADLMRKLLGMVGEDQKNLTIVSTGVIAAGQLVYGYALSEALKTDPKAAVLIIQGSERNPLISGAATQLSNTLGFVMTNSYDGDKDEQEFKKKQAEAISKALGVALKLPFIPTPTGEWTGLILDQAKSIALDAIAKGPKQDAKGLYNSAAGNGEDSLIKLTLNNLLAAGYFDPKQYEKANEADSLKKFVPPPADAFKKGADGKPLVPPEFDFSSPAYIKWGDRHGQVPNEWLQGNVIVPYRNKFPLFGG